MKTWLIVIAVIAVLLGASTGVGFWMWSYTKAELNNMQSELANTEAELTSTEAELASAEAELADIEEVYPLRDFDSYSELETFVLDNIQPYATTADRWYGSALKVQELAMEQGYLVSAVVEEFDLGEYFVSNMAVAGNDLWWWDPEDGEIFQHPLLVYK